MRHYGLTPPFDSGVALFTGSSTFFVTDAYFTCSVSMYLTSALIRSLTDAALPLAANTSPHTGMSGPRGLVRQGSGVRWRGGVSIQRTADQRIHRVVAGAAHRGCYRDR